MDACGNDNTPFEWLTNFASLRHLVLPSRIVFGSSSRLPEETVCNGEELKHTQENLDYPAKIKLNALHVGCGTSTVGEALMCLCERVNVSNNSEKEVQYILKYGHVVNVDIDNTALDSMQKRWEKQQVHDVGKMDWRYIDFANEETCRMALDPYQTMSSCTQGGGYFDLVLDKSTFDCLLCSEYEAVVGLLCEVYHSLRIPAAITKTSVGINRDQQSESRWGGVYVLITFHPLEFVRQMLTELPGAEWAVEHEVVRREVEDWTACNERDGFEEIISLYNIATNSITSSGIHKLDEPGVDSIEEGRYAWSTGTFHPDENYRRTINVFTCRRLSFGSSHTSPKHYFLDREAVRQHVERCCNEWYKTTIPMVTSEREEEISIAFSTSVMDSQDASATLDLKQCYDVLFTELEKEHLDYDYFLEDWEAYCDKHHVLHRDSMTLDVALDFLREMQ
jgi:hypothetical protein